MHQLDFHRFLEHVSDISQCNTESTLYPLHLKIKSFKVDDVSTNQSGGVTTLLSIKRLTHFVLNPLVQSIVWL